MLHPSHMNNGKSNQSDIGRYRSNEATAREEVQNGQVDMVPVKEQTRGSTGQVKPTSMYLSFCD
jgi:hypothetical protein